ncbi:MAG: phosphopyruvate hydratase [Patescibacteria group bacterium]|jgi:enolase
MPRIKNIIAREILDSRGNPTVETRIALDNGIAARASAASACSFCAPGAVGLKDNDKKRYNGMGVLKAVENVNKVIGSKLVGLEAEEQEKIDKLMIELDGTENKKKLGANAILSVSLACARVAAKSCKKELYEYIGTKFQIPPARTTVQSVGNPKSQGLPVPCFNMFNGGEHGDTNLDFKEYMVIPLMSGSSAATPLTPDPFPAHASRARGAEIKSFSDMVRMGAEIYHELGRVLKEAGYDTDTGTEGGYAPDMHSSIQAMELIMAAGVRAGYKPGEDFGLGIDIGSGSLYNKETGKYIFKLDQANFTSANLTGLYYEWFRKYPIVYLEDGLSADDLSGWKDLTRSLGPEIALAGDNFFAAGIKRVREALKEKIANTVVLKPGQAGTLTETIECALLAKKHGYKIAVSARGGETNDDFISDLAVALGAEYFKAGSLSRGERVSKYNRLMEIEENVK